MLKTDQERNFLVQFNYFIIMFCHCIKIKLNALRQTFFYEDDFTNNSIETNKIHKRASWAIIIFENVKIDFTDLTNLPPWFALRSRPTWRFPPY